MTTYQAHKAKTTSEKIVLAWLEPSQRLFAWSIYSGSVYSRTVPYFVSGVRQDSVALTAAGSLAGVNDAGKWFFDQLTRTLYVWSTGSVSPGSVWTDVTYRLFFSNAPIDLPADLVSGSDVPYDARLQKTSKFKAKFDTDQKGIALEGTGSVTLHNNDGYFASIYDRLVWENKTCKIFSYARDLPLSEKVTLFNGVITNKDFDDSKVTFQVKDFIYKLRTALDLPIYDSDDGTLPDSLTGKPKRRIYGRVDGLLCDPVSNMRTSYALQTVSGDLRTGTPIVLDLTTSSNEVVPSSASIHDDCCAGDSLLVNGNTLKIKSLSRVDIGLDTPKDITLTRTSSGGGTSLFRITFTGIVTTGVTVGDHISLSVLSNATTETKSKCLGLFPIATVNASYLEFTLGTAIASLTSDTFKSGVGEIAVTRHTNTLLFTIQSTSPITVTDAAGTITPTVPYRRFNRTYAVAHHALSTRETTITSVITAVKFALADVDGIYEDDTIRINGQLTTVTGLNRIAKQVTVADVILPLPILGDGVDRLGVQRVTYKERDFTQFEDFNPDYDADLGSRIIFEPLAEFNATPSDELASRVTWVNGCKQVLGSNSVFRSLKVRDWIMSQTDSAWYEIAEKFSDNLVILNTPYTGTAGVNLTSVRQPVYISDNSAIVAEVYGRTVEGTEAGSLIITGPDLVRDLMTDAGVDYLIDDTSFDEASVDAPYRMSLALPLIKGDEAPKIRDVLNLVNDSVNGSLYNSLSGLIRYRVLDARRTLDDAVAISDADLIDYSVDTDSSAIYRKVLVRFGAKDADTVTEKETYSVAQSESDFVLNSGIDGQVETLQTALYLRTDAEILSQRVRFVHELATSRVSVKVNLLLADAILNDLVTLDLDRIYQRLGTTGVDRSKTGLISSLSKDGLTVTAIIDDLGNIFNRVAVITDNDAPAYADATEIERRFAGYITDDDGLADGEETFNANLIG